MASANSTARANVYQIITDRIIQQLEKGVVPWRKPWSGEGSEPANLVSRKAYRGINVFMLSCSAYGSPFWLTFKQADMWGGHVRKGERGTPVVFWKFFEGTERDDGGSSDNDAPARSKRAPLLRYYTVFNSEQCDGLPAKLLEVAKVPERTASPIADCDAILDGMPANRPQIEHGFNGAYYRPSMDVIHMPRATQFDTDAAYYATLFHELTHATGHETRLNRKALTGEIRFGSPSYSQEELVAEMGSAFLCGQAGIDTAPLVEQHAAYVSSWLAKLKGDSRLVVTAAAQAQKAADWILRRTWQPAADE